MALLAFALAHAAFAALALAQSRHHRQVYNRVASRCVRILLRGAASAGLALSFSVRIIDSGWSIGPVLWLGLLSAAGVATALLLAFRPRAILVTGMVTRKPATPFGLANQR